ncbi:site-specific integrase [Sphingomonas sp. LY160]|uniref:site-specific integrase n=1 Tax=Sphingomonas sp. LY160 TaxID=3095342 RepID=UPI002ADEC862|nr:tyrosine-type recombinase/integrase [Sphingomonas sp. LY160]MEA1071306.1 tyrosine-type recombinase/integrase [Sphingomonas sp. LY160]
MKYPKHVRRKVAKGKPYFYFDTGMKKEGGLAILTRLPDIRDPKFGGALARAQAARTMRGKRSTALTLDALMRQYEKSPEFAKLSAASKRSYLRYLGVANQLMRDGTESIPVFKVEKQDIIALRDHLSSNHGAANQAVRALSALFSWAIANGKVKDNPAYKVAKFESKDHQPWPDDLLEEGLNDPQVGLAVALFYFTGQRINEVIRMSRRDLAGDHMNVYVQKTKSHIKVAILPDLMERLRGAGSEMALLVNSNGQPWTANGLRQKLQLWAKERGHHVVPHGLRKNAVIALFEAGCTAAEVSGITDQSIGMLEHYAKARNKLALGQSAVVKLADARAARNVSGKGKQK